MQYQFGTSVSEAHWATYLTTPDAETGVNPAGSQIKIEYRSVRDGTARIVRRIFHEAAGMGPRAESTSREIDKQHDRIAYYDSILANPAFPEATTLQDLRRERISIENILAATAQEEEDLVKELLSEDDPYVIEPDEECGESVESDVVDEDYRIVASVVGESACDMTPAARPGQRLRV